MTAESIHADGTPDFCRVLIQVQPEIRIEVSLPARWNRRLYMFGNGGYAGENLEAPGRVSHRNGAVKLGFVVAQTNTGHDARKEPSGSFVMNNPQKAIDAFDKAGDDPEALQACGAGGLHEGLDLHCGIPSIEPLAQDGVHPEQAQERGHPSQIEVVGIVQDCRRFLVVGKAFKEAGCLSVVHRLGDYSTRLQPG